MSEKYTGIGFSNILKKEDKGKLLLPNFQREFVWSRNDQLKLLASFLIDIPIGSILLVNDEGGEYATRKLCYNTSSKPTKGECQYLLDGQQRLSTLKSVFHDFYKDSNWEKKLNDIYHPLRTRWFVKVESNNDEIDWLGWEYLSWEENDLKIRDPQDIFSFIDYEKIHPNQDQKWFHPGHRKVIFEELDEETREYIKDQPSVKKSYINQEIATKAVEDGRIPLFSLRDSSDDSLHNHVLTKLASKRTDQLEAKYKHDPDKLRKIFKNHSQIWDKLDNYEENKDEISSFWKKVEAKWAQKIKSYLEGILEQEIAAIKLQSDEVSRAIPVFEYMNKQGTTLSVFDLVVARAAFSPEGDLPVESLRERVNNELEEEINLSGHLKNAVQKKDKWSVNDFGIFDEDSINYATQQVFLNLLSLNNNVEYDLESIESLKTDDIKTQTALSLSAEEINDTHKVVIKGLKRAFAFIQIRLGAISINDVSYRLMIVPLAFYLQKDDTWESKFKLNKLEFWYWSSLLSDAYRDDKQDRIIGDLKILYEWLEKDSQNPFKNRQEKVLAVEYWCDKNTLLHKSTDDKVHNSIRNGILQFILSKYPVDFLPRKKFEEKRLTAWDLGGNGFVEEKDGEKRPISKNDHHIIPLGSISELGEDVSEIREDKTHILNSPLNLTIISDVANNIIRNREFDNYKKYLEELSLAYHFIPELQVSEDDSEKEVEGFLSDRFEKIQEEFKKHLNDLV